MGEESTQQPIRILFVEDQKADAERAIYQLKRAGMECDWRRVETEQSLLDSLDEFSPDLILSDFSLPRFDGLSALRISREKAPLVPFVFLSGTIGEERAIQALRAGAVDYVLKENMARLAPAIRRAIDEAAARAEQLRQQEQIARLNRVLRMLSGVNGLVLRIRDRNELLRETCRLAVAEGGYMSAIACAEVPHASSIQPVAWSSLDDQMAGEMSECVGRAATLEGSVLHKVVTSGTEFMCNDTRTCDTEDELVAMLARIGLHSAVVLPLLVDGTAIAVLMLTARDAGVLSDEELHMLREVAGNLSFGLQYLQRDTRARFLSHFDPQSGLAKRPLFCERAQRLISLPVSARTRHAVIVLDVERLGVINESFGRRTGDLLVQHIADRLKQAFPSGQIAHFGGGTFALLRSQGERTDEQMRVYGRRQAEKLFGEPFIIEGRTIPVAARSGIALWPNDATDAMTLVQNAEAAVQYARSCGERHVRYNAATRSDMVGQLALEHQLRFALERNEFELHYQPKVSITSRRVRGAEALLRWRKPEEGLVSPVQFIPTLEVTGLIVPVGAWVIRQAARDCQMWKQQGLPPVRIAVNIAPQQLRQPDFEARFLEAVSPWSNEDWGLDIEIIEGSLQEDAPDELAKLRNLRARGVQIAIDDFGIGYSSLSRLATLPVDTLKIDRSFVAKSLDGGSGNMLVRTIIALARSLEMTTVAEGVEKEEELDLLRHLGCESSQGWLHSAAVPAAEFTAILREGKGPLLRPAAHAPRVPRRRTG
ncbi:MAG TPA: EAL domain-containing protein [Steroidobacteraceae bacterium]|nr:EAL domain-containing protein [Steroidobacteraceae bacterium]